MWNQKLCIATISTPKATEEEQLALFKKVGFDGFFQTYSKDIDLKKLVNVANNEGVFLQSVHAPYTKMNHLWEKTNQTNAAIDELLKCLDESKEAGAPIVVMHAFIGFEDHNPTEFGLQNIETIVKRAKELDIKLAFENTEGEEYLAAIMNRFANENNVGFCWDTGHEMCYNHSQDLIKLYGKKLFCTHLNDNLGISRYDGKIFWTDDLHLLPFDGIADWRNIVDRLNGCGFDKELTFELNLSSKPNRHDNDIYANMEIVDYLTEAYKRACRVAALKQSLNTHTLS